MNASTELLRPEISVVIPCRNEEANAAAIAAAVIAELEPVSTSFDIIFIDNASTDDTVPIIRGLCEKDARIRLIANVRNFGQMRSPTHAIFEARGRAVIAMCADFQDPPTLLGQFVKRWRAGTDIVLGVRETEKSSPILAWVRDLSYAMAHRFGDYAIIRNATGFGLYDAKVVRAIAALKEPEPFFRGMLVETGYSIEKIYYSRPVRAGGRSNNNFFSLLDFALSSLAGSSKKLLKVPLFVGVAAGFAAIVTACIGLGLLVAGRGGGSWLVGALVEGQMALMFVFLGLIGEQLRLVSERTRQTPLVIERERVNFPDGY
jgi:glycosyltransferase involved in cell wall biosynthesis